MFRVATGKGSSDWLMLEVPVAYPKLSVFELNFVYMYYASTGIHIFKGNAPESDTNVYEYVRVEVTKLKVHCATL